MRLLNRKYNLEFELHENHVLEIICENKVAFRTLVYDLAVETSGGEGEWILSDNENEYNLAKVADLIINPFAVSCNDRKILSAIYKELHIISDQVYPEQYAEANAKMLNYLDSILVDVPYALEYEPIADVEGIFKLYDVKFEDEYSSILDKLVTYIRTVSQVLRKNVFFFVNLKSYLDDEEIEMLYREVSYSKSSLIMIESSDSSKLEAEKKVLIDSDLCIIEA
ncbi:MAG: type II-A CRISPR-associated protein Csn2 [Pseudobutyrivibrio sp.]|nr:type II-A CRISPR-associated protein Csn2 [Pseudobutyrivibrio sp.]